MTEGVCPALFERIFFRCFPQHASSSLNVFQWLPLFFCAFLTNCWKKKGFLLGPNELFAWHPHAVLLSVAGIFFREELPADILISSWWGRTVHTSSTSTPMDQAARLKDNKSLTHSKPFLATRRTAAFLHLTVRSCSHSRHCYWKGVSSHFSLERRACPAETEGWPRKRYARTKLRWNEKRLNFFAVFDSIPTTFITSFLRFGFPHHPHNSQTLFFSSWALRPFCHMFVFVCVVRVPLGLVALCAHFYFAPVG